MVTSTIQQLFSFANYLAAEAAKISTRYFRHSLALETKAGDYPVTRADREIELHLRHLITAAYPQHQIIGEEFMPQPGNQAYTWVIDPIDGTVAFASGKPTYTTLIALLEDGKPLFGIIDQPLIKERFSGIVAHGAFLNNTRLQTAPQNQLQLARLNATTPDMFISNYERTKFDLLRKQVRITSFGGDAYAFGLLAAGHIDIILEADLRYYDIAALLPLISEAGGVISDWQGQPLTPDFNGQCLACANSELQHQVLELIT